MSQQLELLIENPSQWTAICYITPEIQKKQIKPFVVLALKELEGNPDSRLSSLMNADKYSAVRAVVRHIARLKSANKEPWNHDDIRTFVEGLRFSPECVEELSLLLCTEKIYENMPKHLMVKPGLASLHWKIDLSLCQSNQSEPTPQRCKEVLHRFTHIILTLTLTDGQMHTYRLSITKFHQLRFVVASALKSMIVLEKRKCMRRD